MPGITHGYPDSKRPTTRKPSHDLHHSTSPSAMPFAQPPYPFKTTATGYGLNEPQWSEGPPPLIHDRSPYARVPLPALPPIVLHELLLCRDQNLSAVCWSVHQPPASARLSSSSVYATAYHWKALPAFSQNPRSHSSLTIRVASTPFTRPIMVFPSNPSTGVITIGDVLNSVYRGLRQCANDVLCESMHISPSLLSEQLFRQNGLAPMTTQCIPEPNDEVSSHIAQILEFRTQWVGLAPSDRERDVLVLYTKGLTPR
jgi:hypothetical protein